MEEEQFWTFTAPDGSTVRTTLPETVATKLDLLRSWYDARIAPIRAMRRVAEFEIKTGEKYKP